VFPVRCSNCGAQLANVDIQSCPKCGSTNKTVSLEGRVLSQSKLSANISWQRIEKSVEKNWPLAALLVVLNLVSMIPAYFLSGWSSVLVCWSLLYLC
jgi:phage FluMu protein Com